MQAINQTQASTDKKPQSSELNPGPGFRIKRSIERPSKELIDQFRRFETPDISDMMNRLYTMDAGLKNRINNDSIRGPACTVKVYPGDNLMVHKALDIVEPGDILVIDAGGSSMNGIIGDLISNKAKHRGIAAFVVDGLIRDVPGMKESNLPAYARGVTPIGPLHRGPGEINYPISCGGIVVNPGDIICGDENGITVVRKEFAEDILDRLIKKEESLSSYVANVKKGIFSNAWVDDMLDAAECEYED